MSFSNITALLRGARNMGRDHGIKQAAARTSLFVTDLLSDVIKPLGKARAIQAIEELRKHPPPDSLEALVQYAFEFRAAGVRIDPEQGRREIKSLLESVVRLKPRVLLEIGTYHGGTLFLFAAVADSSARILSLDLYQHAHWRFPIYKSFPRGKQSIELMAGNSHNPKTLKEVLRILGQDKLDFLFIDADHSYHGVRQDFQMYSPLVREGGIVAFHDIVPSPVYTGCEVYKFWDEVKHEFLHEEIIESRSQIFGGMGVLHL